MYWYIPPLQNVLENLEILAFVQVKENICGQGYVADSEDRSVTRSSNVFLSLIKEAGYKVSLKMSVIRGFGNIDFFLVLVLKIFSETSVIDPALLLFKASD